MPRPLPNSLAESVPVPTELAPTADVLRTLGGIGLPGTADVDRMEGISAAPENGTVWDRATMALAHTRELFSRIGLVVPELADFAAAGVDFQRLQTVHETMRGLNLEPQLVLAPVLAPAEWKNFFKAAQDDRRINHDGRIKNGGLYINDEVERNWDSLQGNRHNINIGGSPWQVLVVPGTNKPTVTNIDHNGTKDGKQASPELLQQAQAYVPLNQQSNEFMHTTIPAYLTLQATKLLNHEEPLDGATWAWLEGDFENGSRAPFGDWNPDVGQVRLYCGDVGLRADSLGVRLPVWGNQKV
jgi:hypothetical protein